MPPNKKLMQGVINPFSDAFLEHWDIWKMYKKEAFNFSYKGVISEQMALKHLVDLSDGEEEKAIKIIQQSIRRQWQGFFPLHETATSNGKPGTKKSGSKAGEPPLRDRVQAAFNKKFGGGEQAGDEPNLKAV
jgi:hypothetical protein